MKFLNYLLLKTPEQKEERMSIPKDVNKVSTRRILLSLVGILLGISLSFIVTGIEPVDVPQDNTEQVENNAQNSNVNSDDIKVNFPDWNELINIGIISLVICLLTYQALYFSLKLYNNEPAFLIIFISFQYGFFWQAVIKTSGSII
mgnify:CR=1 FL=1